MATEPSEFEGFVRRYQDMVYTTAARLLGRGPDAEDVSQEVFLKAYEAFEGLGGGAWALSPRAGGWLRTVATNLSLNHLTRHRGRWKLFSELAGEDGAGAEELFAAPEPGARADPRLLQEALLRLPDHQRVPLVLFHFSEMSYEDIAGKLGVSLAKVKSDIFRARSALKRSMGDPR